MGDVDPVPEQGVALLEAFSRAASAALPLAQRAVQEREVERRHVLAASRAPGARRGARAPPASRPARGERAAEERHLVAVLPLRHRDGALQRRDRLVELARRLQRAAQRPERERGVGLERDGLLEAPESPPRTAASPRRPSRAPPGRCRSAARARRPVRATSSASSNRPLTAEAERQPEVGVARASDCARSRAAARAPRARCPSRSSAR